MGNFETPYDLDGPAQVQFELGDQLASVVAIASQQLDDGQSVLQGLKQGLGSLLIGFMGTGHLDG